MFNLDRTLEAKEIIIVRNELQAHGIHDQGQGVIHIRVGDESTEVGKWEECVGLIEGLISEIKPILHEKWRELRDIARTIKAHSGYERGGTIENVLFLRYVKQAFLLARNFTDLEDVCVALRDLLYIDISKKEPELIESFNVTYLYVRSLHRLIMDELYRLKLVKQIASMKKIASIAGPWSNLDLAWEERVYPYSDEEGDMLNRREAIRRQTRYNPEYNMWGYYFVWQDRRRDPYRFEDMKTDSPYPSRELLTIP